MVEKINEYAKFKDDRGCFRGIMNTGQWQEVNHVFTNKGAVRGKHFHKHLNEVVFLLKGEMEVELVNVLDGKKSACIVKQGEGVIIKPYQHHTMRYLTDCEQLSFLDKPFDQENPDLHTEL